MKTTIIIICLILCSILLIGCDKPVEERDEVFVKIPSDSYTLELSTESTFYIPIDLNYFEPNTAIVLQESPIGSELVFIEGCHFLKWSPTDKGQYRVRASNEANNFAQVYILIVK